jgi:hypothetical protein
MAAASFDWGKLAPIQTLRWKYSLGLRGRASLSILSSPVRPIDAAMASMSSEASVDGTQAQPCSDITNRRFGKRSKTPPRIICHSARWAIHAVSTAQIRVDAA